MKGTDIKKGAKCPIKDNNGNIVAWTVQWIDFNNNMHTRRWEVSEHGEDGACILSTQFIDDNKPS